VILHQCGAGTSLLWVITGYAVFAMGFGMVNAPITNTAVSGMPDSQAGVAAAVASTSRQVGAALGVALAGSILNSALAGSVRSGFIAAARPAWLLLAGLGLVVLVLGVLSSSRRARRTAAHTAALFEADALAAAAFVPDSSEVR
jgi:hypothetical protein